MVITAEIRAEILRLCAEGLGRNEIARQLGVSQNSVSVAAAKAGHSFNREKTAEATRVRAVDAKARRAELLDNQLLILSYAQRRILDTFEGRAKWKTLAKASFGAEETKHLNYIPPRDLKDTQASLSAGMTVVNRLEAGLNPAAEEAGSILDKIAGTFGIDDAEPAGADE